MMKKGLTKFVIALLFVCLLWLAIGCGEEIEKQTVFSVTFESNGEIVSTQTVEEGKTVTAVACENGDHDFVCWHTNSLDGEEFEITTPIYSDFKVIAEWTSTVTMNNEDGSFLEYIEVKKGETFEPSVLPTKKSDGEYTYTFKGWDKELVGTGSDMTVTAEYEKAEIKRTVTFYYGTTQVGTLEVKSGSKLETGYNYKIEDDNYYTYTLTGWTTSSGDDYDFSTPVTSNLNLYAKTTRTPLPMDFTGKKLSMLGDSVSTFYVKGDPFCSYYGGDNQFYYPKYCNSVSSGANTYWGQLITKLGLTLGINESYSGTTCYGSGNTVACSNYRISHLDDNGTPDIILVFIGINDNASGYTTQQFKTAYNSMLGKISSMYPTSYVFCVTHPYSNYHLNQPTNHAKYSEETRLAYNEIIMELADKYQYGLVRLDECQTTENWNQYLADNLHPSQTGHNAWFKQFYKDIVNYFNQTKEEITISYQVEEGASVSENATTKCHKGDIFTLPTAIKEGYIFNGWFDNSEYNGTEVTDTSTFTTDTVLFAELDEDPGDGKMYIRYVYNGGVKEGSDATNNVTFEIVDSGSYSLPNATREGYTFSGWYTNPLFTGSRVYTAKANIKVYAKWTKNA